MTHSLHRRGNYDSLINDFVWQPYPAQNINDKNLPEKFRAIIEIVEDLDSINWGDIKIGPKISVDIERIKERLTKRSRIRGVFTDKSQVVEFLKRMKDINLGLSVVISGITDEVLDACKKNNLNPHSINMSLGVWGKKEMLPSEDILEITTMCGHHMISTNIVRKTIEDVKKGRITTEAAGRSLARLCPCGIFNNERAAKLFKKNIKKD
jgi:hypothetical protein